MSNSNGFRVQVTVELGHHASTRKKPTQEGFTHDWTVFVRGPDGSKIHYFIEKVVFHLHETFAKAKRVVKEPPYSVSESGYAGFIINIDIYFKNKENPKKISINYDLFLPAEGFDPINHTHCEKLTFQNPTEEFRSKLLKAGGVEYPIGSAPPNQPFTDLFGPPIISDGKKIPSQSGKEKDKGSKYKTSSTPDVLKSSTSHSTLSVAPGPPPIASKDIKPLKDKSSGKEVAAQKRMLKSSPEQSSGKKLKRDNSAESKDKEKRKSQKEKKHSDTTDSKTSSTVKSESSRSKSKDKSEHVKMKEGSKKHRSDKIQSGDSKPSNHSSSKSLGDVKKKPEKPSPLQDSPKTDSSKSSDSLKRKVDKVSPLQDSPLTKDSSKYMGDVKRKPEKLSPLQDSSDADSSDSDSLPSSKAVSSSCSSPLSSLSEDDEDVQMVMSIIAEDSDASLGSPDVSRKHQADSEPKDRKPPVIKSESKPSKSQHSSHTSAVNSKKSSQSKSSAKPEMSSKTDSSKSESSKSESSSKSLESSKTGTKSDVSKPKDSKDTKHKKEKLPTTPSKTSSKTKDVKDSKPQTESKSVKCVNGNIPEKAPNGEKIVNLLEMQRTIMKLSDRKVLQQVANLISKTGMFDITEETFDFDLCKLDIGTVNKIRNAIAQNS
ncbi:protein AF-9-like isoform X2 [Gigantopelta aegis]|uniref:protein AF-9-like isoform X2 n=1 Tax=Gigantopelta aegis TaxID=1735272 RepID=UPI001B88CC48|nr:protein AF-9-like isoform X2 [Gigantopelta aegis]